MIRREIESNELCWTLIDFCPAAADLDNSLSSIYNNNNNNININIALCKHDIKNLLTFFKIETTAMTVAADPTIGSKT